MTMMAICLTSQTPQNYTKPTRNSQKELVVKRLLVLFLCMHRVGFDNPRSVSACVPEAFALSTSLSCAGMSMRKTNSIFFSLPPCSLSAGVLCKIYSGVHPRVSTLIPSFQKKKCLFSFCTINPFPLYMAQSVNPLNGCLFF